MKRVLTLREKSILSNGFFGAVWIVMGIVQIFQNNTFLKLVATVLVLVGSVSMMLPYFIKTESEDEMSEYNKNRAKARIYEILSLGISIFTLIAVFNGTWRVDLKIVLPFILGGVNLFEFILFVVYEKVGV